MSDDKFLVAAGTCQSKKVYHTDESCRAIQRADNPRYVPERVLRDDVTECKICRTNGDCFKAGRTGTSLAHQIRSGDVEIDLQEEEDS